LKVAAVKFDDVDRLHRHVTDSRGPYAANRMAATLAKMFSLAVRWGYRADNPCKGVAANGETRRRRYLKDDELPRLLKAMAAHPNRCAVNIVRIRNQTKGRSFRTSVGASARSAVGDICGATKRRRQTSIRLSGTK
jgi:hypothetical protein